MILAGLNKKKAPRLRPWGLQAKGTDVTLSRIRNVFLTDDVVYGSG